MASNNERIIFKKRGQSSCEETVQRWVYYMDEQQQDLLRVLTDFEDTLAARIEAGQRRYAGLKITLVVTADYQGRKEAEHELYSMHLRTSQYCLLADANARDTVEHMVQEIQNRNENVIKKDSSSYIENITYLTVFISRFEPLAAAGFKPLPAFLKSKRAIVNVKNTNDMCFAYAVASALEPATAHIDRPGNYDKFFEQLQLNQFQYPMKPEQVREVENRLNLRINIFSFYDDEGKGRYPLYISKRTDAKEIDLLYWDEHYAWIKDFSAFIYDLAPTHRRKFFCKRCFGLFLAKASYERHLEICSRGDFSSQIYQFPQAGTFLRFTNIQNQLEVPFVIYADFECLLQPTEGMEQKRTTYYQTHLPTAVGFYIVPSEGIEFTPRYETYTGKDVVKWFLQRLLDIADEIESFMEKIIPLDMTVSDWIQFNAAQNCSICLKPFDLCDPLQKVKDHDHRTGKFRGAAHVTCNLQLQERRKIPVFLHNFRGYDSHLIALAVEHFQQTPLGIIGQGYEKYLTLSFGKHLVFKDTYQFLSYSLEQLAKELLKTGPHMFIHLRKQFPDLSQEDFNLLVRKGVFPYDYIDSWEKLNERALPPIEKFANALRNEKCDPADYAHAQKVWQVFGCQIIKDYQDLYVKTDVLIQTDVFENFRKNCMLNYRLDAAHYVSSPHISWDAMLLYTGAEIELVSDPEIFKLIDHGIRGGISMIVHRYAHANNPEMGADYKPDQELSYIFYGDINNLYGNALKDKLPIRNFKWLREEEWNLLDWTTLPDDSTIGYILECDLECPQSVHDRHADYPLAPEKRFIQWEEFSDYQIRVFQHYSVPKNSLHVQKLVPHLLPKLNYVVHYRNLKFYLEEGLLLKKIHKVLQFEQENWLAPYILKNQDLRAKATTESAKNLAKLLNNAVYGKCVENQKKRTTIKLAKNKRECKRWVEKPQMRGFKIFTENLSAVDLRKVYAKIDKPFYAGFTVLELSKLHMYKFHYQYIRSKFGNAAQLLFTDTDSLMYHFRGINPFPQFYKDRAEYFDFSDYPSDHPHFDAANKKVIGKMKDEAMSKQIIEFVGLRPKMYSYLLAGVDKIVNKHTAKGIKYATSKTLTHQDFLAQLKNPQENRLANRRIGTKLHQLYTIKTMKRGLSAFDDKRVLLEDGISSLPYGHYKVTREVVPIGIPDNDVRHFASLAVPPGRRHVRTQPPERHAVSLGNPTIDDFLLDDDADFD